MLLARVTGTLVATCKEESFQGEKLLLLEPLDQYGHPDGTELIAVDRAGAGVGEIVLVVQEGGSARQIMGKEFAPVEAIIVAILDTVTIGWFRDLQEV